MVRAAAALHRAQRPGDAAGPLGGGRRLLAVHARRRDRRAAGGRRARRRQRRAGASPTSCARRPTPGTTRSSAGPTSAGPSSRTQSASTATTCASRRRTRPRRRRRSRASCRSRTARSAEPVTRRRSVVSPDALALVRFGLRAADDPRIVNTVQVIDALLKLGDGDRARSGTATTTTATASTPTAAPFDGTGIGRGWPLLAGERAHYELAAGRRDEAARLLRAHGGAGERRRADPRAGLGRRRHPGARALQRPAHRARRCRSSGRTPSTSSCVRSLRDGAVFDMPPQTAQRYVERSTPSRVTPWRFNQKCRSDARRARSCASSCWRPASCTGAPTAGRPCTTPRPPTARSACTTPTCRRPASRRRDRDLHVPLARRRSLGRHRLQRRRGSRRLLIRAAPAP